MTNKLTFYRCHFCEFEFSLFKPFPADIMPYCPNCNNDEHITELEAIDTKG